MADLSIRRMSPMEYWDWIGERQGLTPDLDVQLALGAIPASAGRMIGRKFASTFSRPTATMLEESLGKKSAQLAAPQIELGSYGGQRYSVPEDLFKKYYDTVNRVGMRSGYGKGMSRAEAFAADLERSRLHNELAREALKVHKTSYDSDIYPRVKRMISDFAEEMTFKE